MPVELQISEEDIALAESVLLPKGKHFDEERRLFIKCFETSDLQAVPGSGKTTALLAKLLALDRHLSAKNTHGVLVISHTNAAVNEIHERIGGICPKLLSYPNFIGTIQSFVDKFLAIPSYVDCFGFRPNRIDADAYNSEISRRFQRLRNRVEKWVQNNKGGGSPEELVQKLRFDPNLNLTNGIGGKTLLKSASKSFTYETLAGLKYEVIKSGVLHFEDVFWLSDLFLQENAQVRRLLQKRFKYVFVDEMQDMAPHQQGILESIFGPEGNADSIYQRIGDTDQAIFGGTEFMDTEIWKPRAKTLTLSKSQRLSSPIAKILAPFAYQRDEDFDVIGLQPSTALPHLLIYDDDSAGELVGRYAALIEEHLLDGSIPVDAPRRYMAIAWNCEWTDAPSPSEGKRRLIDFCPTFQRSTLRKQEEFEYLTDYLAGIDRDDSTLRSARSAILRAICRALRISKVLDPKNERAFTPASLIRYVRFEASEKSYARLNRKLLSWSIKLVSGETHSVLLELQKVIPKLISHFNGDVVGAKGFLEMSPVKSYEPPSMENTNPNSLTFGNIQIDLGTVHSVKGQTHTATLYIESAYYNDGGKSYESQRLAAQFKGERLRANAKKRVKESAKMIYVGFSRPTHLLVFAVHKKHYDSHLSEINRSEWNVIYADEAANDKHLKQNANSL